MVRKILLIGPQSEATQAGAVRAAAVAERAGAAVEFLDVVYDPHLAGYLGAPEVYESLHSRIVSGREAEAQDLAATFQARGVDCTVNVVWADARHRIVANEAAAEEVDLVILEPEDPLRGLSQDEWRLISICPAPVLVARGGPDVSYTSIVAAVDPERAHDKPVGLDARIVEQAKVFGDLFGARINVVYCSPPLASFIRDPIAEYTLRDTVNATRDERAHALEALARDAGVSADAVSVIEGRAEDVLSERSAEDGTLVVIGNVARGPIARRLLGNTAARVLRRPGGDVLVVKTLDFGLTADEIAD